MIYQEEDFLQLSGLQHFRFCRRQWALIHIEHQWAENFRTVDGMLLHEHAHDPSFQESRGDRLITRGVSVYSGELGVSGQCDVVEYKRGSPREDSSDALQLCAQALCLEAMLCCDIPEGAVYYGEIRRRQKVAFTQELRCQVRTLLTEMHELYRRGYTPKVKPSKSCNACSLKELCLPRLMKTKPVSDYLKAAMEETP